MLGEPPLADWRVLEFSTGIAVSYCGKLFADAGAEVVKVEKPDGDPMRYWQSHDTDGNIGSPGVLFGYLAESKKSVVAERGSLANDLIGGADLVLSDLTTGPTLDELARAAPHAVVVVVTPFGTHGPYVDEGIEVNEFILQAMCGSTWGRGWPGSEPLQAGGRIGEWLAGAFAATIAAATVRQKRATASGAVIDFSVYEAMVIGFGGLAAMSTSVLAGDSPLPPRTLELPSIVPTADGLVGFCTITAQQFQDFLVLIERPDLLDDDDLASLGGRVRRRDEFLEMVHNWAQSKTTDEIIDTAVALRIPVAPIATPGSVTSIDHFVQRGVFVKSVRGALQPRVPYRSSAFGARTGVVPPDVGADTGAVHWPARTASAVVDDVNDLPLQGIRVADFTAFWAGPLATQVLAGLGADVIKVEGVRRPDGMRFSGTRPPNWDQWWEWGPTYQCTNTNKRSLTLELSDPRGHAAALELIKHSDLVIENFSPRVMTNLGLEWAAVQSANPRAVMVRMPAFGLDGPWRDRVGFAQTMEQATGMAWMTGEADGPPVLPRGVCDPIAGLHAAFAAIAAIVVRDRTDAGMQVEATMVESALNIAAEMVLEYSEDGIELRRDGNRGPDASPQGVYRCAGDDAWVAISVSDELWPSFTQAIGAPELSADTTLNRQQERRRRADYLDKVISDWTMQRTPADVVARLRARGVAAAQVTVQSALLDDEQLLARGFWETVDHPVAGTFKCLGLPFTVDNKPRNWVRTPAPLFGQHNEEVLSRLLGIADAELKALAESGVISDRPAGL
ncbi:CoA transferase [Mycobacterium sp. 94-17]|uniref:CaiB/BaiF CoA-transferase family protein n=1 Tax=Mycobacterium sp. 94-17 TaxID=2986147 RepID=UPI002D1EB9A0|nr:CoA transferase [Mycobacterium sp. 94-17]MEB4209706.1 CoA transferase [Mycobacterium sp. 94-17]